MATPCRHILSGIAGASLVVASAAIGWVPSATAADPATSSAFVAPYSCPATWPALRVGPPSGAFDGNASVLVGGSLRVTGAAAGAEGTVVTLGDATFARDVPGAYEVGVTAFGSQVSPYAGADMLAVGGNLAGAPGTHIDVGQGIGGDVAVAGAVADGTDIDEHGGQLYQAAGDATAPFLDLAGQLAPKSAGYAALPDTGSVEVDHHGLTLVGDGVSNVQVFSVDGAVLAEGRDDGEGDLGRYLQLQGVPADATVVVNLTGPAVALRVDTLLSPEGLPVDPLSDPYFASLATHLLWNAPAATAVSVGGRAQLPGSLLVPTAPSTTTLAGAGTNGRVLVGGDLVHTGQGELHSYPFLGDAQMTCAADPVHLTKLTLDVELVDPDRVVDRDRYFEGDFTCRLSGQDATPPDHEWKLRAVADTRVISDQIPAGATCTVKERLDAGPAPGRSWVDPVVSPDSVVVAKRAQLGFTITNKVREVPQVPTQTSTPTPTPAATPTSDPSDETVTEPPPIPETSEPPASAGPSTISEPTNRPTLPSSPSALPSESAAPTASPTPTVDAQAPNAEPPHRSGPAGPLTTTAPFTLRGAFVWGPLLMLSLLTLLLKARGRPRRQH